MTELMTPAPTARPQPARRFLSTEAGAAGLLLAATLAALLLANSPWSWAYQAL